MADARGAAAYAVVAWLPLQVVSISAPVLAAESPRRVFLLQGTTYSDGALHRAIEAFNERLKERSFEDIRVYTEFLDLQRFTGPENPSLADSRLYSYHIGMSIGSVQNAINALLLGLSG